MAKQVLPISSKHDRVVVLVDMDCFYCQVEEKVEPSLRGKPVAVVQYNAWQGGGIIAVNYAARDQGVTRHMRGDEAKTHCPDIELVRVPSVRGKADLTKYRTEGKEVASVLQSFTALLERASVDEAYLDITEQVNARLLQVNSGQFKLEPSKLINTFAVGHDEIGDYVKKISSTKEEEEEDDSDDVCDLAEDLEAIKRSNIMLLIGATIVNEVRAKVKEITGYECSAGIAHNKILAKLACGLNKPNKQTILPIRKVSDLFQTLPVSKVKGLGGKFGEILCDTLKIKYMGDLLAFSEKELQKRFDEKKGSWLYLISRGVDLEAVTPRFSSKSIGCCKKFPGKNAIADLKTLTHWLHELAGEICDRLEMDLVENNRKAQLMVVSYMQTINGDDLTSSRSIALDTYDVDKMVDDALDCLHKSIDPLLSATNPTVLHNSIKYLGLSASKFEKLVEKNNKIQQMFDKQKQQKVNNPPPQTPPVIATVEEKSSEAPAEGPKLSFFQRHFKKVSEEKLAQERLLLASSTAADRDCGDAGPSTSLLQVRSVEKINNSTGCESNVIPVTAPPLEDSHSDMEDNPLLVDTDPMAEVYLNPTPEYKKEYAEFQCHDFINLDDFKKECAQCGRKVPNYEYQTHLDWHMAMQVSKELKETQRQEQQQAKTAPKPNKKSPNPAASSPISKFFQKATSVANTTGAGDVQICAECGASVLLINFIEHCDYHAAKKLQMELNHPPVTPIVAKCDGPVKKMRKVEKNKRIEMFFKG